MNIPVSPQAEPPGDYRNFERCVGTFDKAWRQGPPPRIEDYLPPVSAAGSAANDPGRRTLLEELVRIDLERRWNQETPRGNEPAPGAVPRNQTARDPLPLRPRLEDYVARYPELGALERVSVELIGEEYRVRRFCSDQPAHAEYAARFTRHAAMTTIMAMLYRIDAELAHEFPDERKAMSAPGPAGEALFRSGSDAATALPLTSVAELLEALRRNQLLEPAQLEELTTDLARRFPEPRPLAGELLRRGWLTAYQVNQLLRGRADELVLGPYLVLERLGEGGTGQVFKARHRRMQRIVALKLMRRELLEDAEVVGRFYREIQVVSQMTHANVVHAYDAGPVGALHFLAMEYVEGIDLGRLVKKVGPLPAAQACDYVRQAALGLQHAHERGLVHRDIKPGNLLVSSIPAETKIASTPGTAAGCWGLVKLLDLGLARLSRRVNDELTTNLTLGNPTNTLTPVGAVLMGTPDYMAPEQAIEFHAADIRADIYGLGCSFFYLLTGQPPFPGGTPLQKILHHQQVEAPAVEQLRPTLPSGVGAVLRRLMAKRPEDRPQTPQEVAAALTALMSGGAWPNRPEWLTCPGASQRVQVAANPAPPRLDPLAQPAVPAPFSSGSMGAKHGFAKAIQWRTWGRRRTLVCLIGGLALLGLAPAGYWLFGPSPIQRLRRKLDQTTDLKEAWPLYQNFCERHPGTPEAAQAGEVMWQYLIDLRTRSPESPQAVDAGIRMTQLPSPLDQLPQGGHASHPDVVAQLGQAGEPKIVCLAISPDCKHVAGCRENGAIDIWEGSTGKKLFSLGEHKGTIAMAFSPHKSKQLVTASSGKTMKIWDLATRTHRTWDVPSQASFAFSPDGKKLATTNFDTPGVMLWDVDKDTKKPLFSGIGSKSLYFSPNGETLAWITEHGFIIFWNLATGKERQIVGLPIAFFLAFAPDSRTGAMYAFDSGLIELWDVAEGKRIKTLDKPVIRRHFLTFASDGRRLVTGYTPATGSLLRIGLLEYPSGNDLWQVDSPGYACALAADGRHVLVNGGGIGYVVRIPQKVLGR